MYIYIYIYMTHLWNNYANLANYATFMLISDN